MKFYIWTFPPRKSVDKIQVSLKSDRSNGYFTWRPIYIFGHISHSFFRTRNVSEKIVEKIKTHIFCSVIFFFFRKSCRLWGNVEKYCRAGRASNDNVIWRMHITCWIAYGYRHTLGICNTYCFSTATVVARTRHSVTSYVHCLSSHIYKVIIYSACRSHLFS
jgi:hypothetical protein